MCDKSGDSHQESKTVVLWRVHVRSPPTSGGGGVSSKEVLTAHCSADDWPRAAAEGFQPRVMCNAHCNVLHDAFSLTARFVQSQAKADLTPRFAFSDTRICRTVDSSRCVAVVLVSQPRPAARAFFVFLSRERRQRRQDPAGQWGES